MNTSGNDFGAMNTLMSSATGRTLLADAEKRGVKIEFKPNNGDSQAGKYNPNTKTITVEHNSLEKMTEVLGHELVHATTPENGNSMKEEKMAFIMGEKIAKEAGVDNKPHSDAFWNNFVDNKYKSKNLKDDNGIMSALHNLDIAAREGAPKTNKGSTQNSDFKGLIKNFLQMLQSQFSSLLG